MSDYNLADQLELAARIVREGLRWEMWSGAWDKWLEAVGAPLNAMHMGYTIRIKPAELPPLPPGRVWHRADAVGPQSVAEGWRPLMLGEPLPMGKYQYLSNINTDWAVGTGWGKVTADTHPVRTKEPLPKVQLPPLPPGARWHKPEAITPEMIAEGWRPMMAGERRKPDAYEVRVGEEWGPGQCYKDVDPSNWPLRTKAPMPAPQPLSAADVIPGDAIRATGSTEAHVIPDVYPDGVTAGRAGTELSWERLMADFEIRDRASGQWRACSKEVAS